MLKLTNIIKKFGENTVLNGIDIEIKEGEIYGLIGANGAGKTTLMNIISKQLLCDGGTVEIDGIKVKSINDIAGKIGYMLDIPAMFEFLDAYEYFEFLCAAQNMTPEEIKTKTVNLLKQVGLSNVGNKRIKKYSRGMKQRLGIAAALLTEPKIILMDEPSSALDPQGRAEVIEIIENLAKNGKTIILSTHILNDVERVCTRIGILAGGTIVTTGTVAKVMQEYQENTYKVECDETEVKKVLKQAEKSSAFDSGSECMGGALIKFKENKKREMFKAIANIDADITGIYLKPVTIEEIFLKASKKEAE